MSEAPDPLKEVERAALELVPQLTARLAKLGLGEIEVRQGELRVRVARALDGAAPAPAAAMRPSAAQHAGVALDRVGVVASGPGLPVDKGDELGHVEMLGVRHDVRAPRLGTVRNLVTEAGEAVEYGQLLIELEAAE